MRREGRALNRDYRGKDYATNVLTFVYDAAQAAPALLRATSCSARRWCAREAREQGKALRAHYAHLTVHGVLHLQGYDHERARDAAQHGGARDAAASRRLGFDVSLTA